MAIYEPLNNTRGNGVVRKRKDNTENGFKHISENETVKRKENKKVVGIVFASLLLDLLAFTMILPLFPSLMDYYDKEEGKGNGLYASLLQCVRAFQRITGTPDNFASVLFAGVLGSMFSFLQFLASPIVGSLSDTYGRKPTLIVCLIGIALSHALWGYAQTFSIFVIARFIGGLSKANISLSMAVVTDVSDDKTRAKGMALVGMAFSIGFTMGPLAGAWFARASAEQMNGLWGEKPAYCALTLALMNIALVIFCLPETLPKEKRSKGSFALSRAKDFVSPWHLTKFTAVKNLSEQQNKVLSKLGFIYLLYLFIYSGLEFTITFLSHHRFGYSSMQQGRMFFVIGIIMAILQGGAARRLSANGAVLAARGSVALTPLSFMCVALAALQNPPLFTPLVYLWLGFILFAISTAFAVTCMSSMAAAQSPSESRGAVLGCVRSLGALARAAGPLVASSMYWCSGAAVTYSIGSVMLIIPAVMLFRLKM